MILKVVNNNPACPAYREVFRSQRKCHESKPPCLFFDPSVWIEVDFSAAFLKKS